VVLNPLYFLLFLHFVWCCVVLCGVVWCCVVRGVLRFCVVCVCVCACVCVCGARLLRLAA